MSISPSTPAKASTPPVIPQKPPAVGPSETMAPPATSIIPKPRMPTPTASRVRARPLVVLVACVLVVPVAAPSRPVLVLLSPPRPTAVLAAHHPPVLVPRTRARAFLLDGVLFLVLVFLALAGGGGAAFRVALLAR